MLDNLCFEALLEGGAAVDSVDKKGWTLLHHAAEDGNMEIFKVSAQMCYLSLFPPGLTSGSPGRRGQCQRR